MLATTDALIQRGPTADRPTSTRRFTGKVYFDTTINALIRWNGTDWILVGLPVYTSNTARDTAITAPTVGAEAYVSSNDAIEGPLYRASANVWRKPWNMPWGVIGSNTGTTAGAQTTADLTSGQVAWTATANRSVRVSWMVCVLSSTAGIVNAGVLDLSNAQIQYPATSAVGATYVTLSGSVLVTPAAGSAGYKLHAAISTGTYTEAVNHSIIVEDIGPSGAPA